MRVLICWNHCPRVGVGGLGCRYKALTRHVTWKLGVGRIPVLICWNHYHRVGVGALGWRYKALTRHVSWKVGIGSIHILLVETIGSELEWVVCIGATRYWQIWIGDRELSHTQTAKLNFLRQARNLDTREDTRYWLGIFARRWEYTLYSFVEDIVPKSRSMV